MAIFLFTIAHLLLNSCTQHDTMTTAPLYLRDPSADPSFSYESSPDLYLFTSLTAGSSHIITATSRLETILKANRIPFKAVDCATDEKARRIWSRRAGKRKLPGLVKRGEIVADLEQTEEWNEYGEIKDNLGGGQPAASPAAAQTQTQAPVQPAALAMTASAAQPTQPQPSALSASTGSPVPDTPLSPQPPADPIRSAQSVLATEAAARGALRSKPKPIPSPAATLDPHSPSTSTHTSSVHFATEANPGIPLARVQSESNFAHAHAHAHDHSHARLTSTSPEADSTRDLDMSDPHPKHNTSQHTGLPALVMRTKAATTEQHSEGGPVDESSPHIAIVPSPSTVEPVSAAAPTSIVTENAAVPATKSGLEAVTADPEKMAKEMRGEGARTTDGAVDVPASLPSLDLGETVQDRHSKLSDAPEDVVKAVENKNSIPEAPAEEEAEAGSEVVEQPAPTESVGGEVEAGVVTSAKGPAEGAAGEAEKEKATEDVQA